LTCILDHCHYPYCQYKTSFDNWKQRSEHITRHCDLKAAAGLILQLKERGLDIKASFKNLFSRSGTLKSLQGTLTSYYGPSYNLESLCLPWVPLLEDFRIATSFPEERMYRLPSEWTKDGTKGGLCKFCRGEKPEKCRLCGIIRIRKGRKARRARATRDRKRSLPLMFACSTG
jgi:hypothetical protein